MVGMAEGAGTCCAERGTAASTAVPITRTKLKLHFHPTHFIDVSTPLALDSTAGDPPLDALHYTQGCLWPQFEIFISRIRFSDAPVTLLSARFDPQTREAFTLCNLPSSV